MKRRYFLVCAASLLLLSACAGVAPRRSPADRLRPRARRHSGAMDGYLLALRIKRLAA
jgi:hypothetical protein